jgi:hypothetical protein
VNQIKEEEMDERIHVVFMKEIIGHARRVDDTGVMKIYYLMGPVPVLTKHVSEYHASINYGNTLAS